MGSEWLLCDCAGFLCGLVGFSDVRLEATDWYAMSVDQVDQVELRELTTREADRLIVDFQR